MLEPHRFILAFEREANQTFYQNPRLLPAEGDWETLKRWGIKIVEARGLFYECQLPDGWTKEIYEYRWTRLLDDRGLYRAQMFVKESLYESKARIFVNAERYILRRGEVSKEEAIAWEVYDLGKDELVEQFTSSGSYAVSPDGNIGFIFEGKFFRWLEKNFLGIRWKKLKVTDANQEKAVPLGFLRQINREPPDYLVDFVNDLTGQPAQRLAQQLNAQSGW